MSGSRATRADQVYGPGGPPRGPPYNARTNENSAGVDCGRTAAEAVNPLRKSRVFKCTDMRAGSFYHWGVSAKLSESEIHSALHKLTGWSVLNSKLHREYKFADFIH